MEKYKKIFLTIGIAVGAFVINYCINFFLTPYITDNVGTEAYGYVSLAKTLASYANIITVALNGYASRFIAVEYHNKRYKQANIYYSSVLFADIVLGAVLFLVMVLFSANIELFFEIEKDILFDVKGLFILIFLNLALNISTTVLQSASYIKNKLDVVAIFRGVSYFAEAGILLLCYISLPPHVSYVGIGILTGSVVICLCNLCITQYYTPELKPQIRLFSFSAVKKLVTAGIWNSVGSIGSLLNTGLDLLVTNLWLSPLAMGQISIVKNITVIFSTIYQQVTTPFQPILLHDYAVRDKETLLKNLVKEIKISGWVSALILMGFASLGRLYFTLWVPNQDIELLYRISLIAILGGIIEGAAYPLYYVYTLTVKNKFPSIMTILGGVCNVIGMYFLIHYTDIGIYAIQWTTTFVTIILCLVIHPLYSAYCLKIVWHSFYPVLFRHIGLCVVIGIIFYGITMLIEPTTWIHLVGCAMIEGLIGGIIYFLLAFNRDEKSNLYHFIMNHIQNKVKKEV